MRWSFLGLSDNVDADAGPPEDADIAAATVRAREAFDFARACLAHLATTI